MSTNVTELSRKPATPILSLFDAASTLIRMREVEGIVGMKRSTIYKLMQRPECGFPQEEITNARQAETLAATAYAQAVAWGDVEGEKTASSDAQKAAKNLTAATEHNRRQQLIITALEQELVTVDRHITEAQEEHQKIQKKGLRLAHDVLEEKWNEAARALLDVGGKLYAVDRLIGRDPVSFMMLNIPEQGENFGSWKWGELADRSSQHRVQDLLSL